MNIEIIAAGKLKNSPLCELWLEYFKRITTFKIKLIEFEEKNISKENFNQKLLSKLNFNSFIIMLDENGKEFNSKEFSIFLNNSFNNYNTISFVIAGADGFTSDTKNNANLLLSLGKLTMPHKLARIVLIEQLYRAETIIKKHPYHK